MPKSKAKTSKAKAPGAKSAKSPALVVVESPTKQKTIARFLSPKEFVVKSSYGHVRDLPEKRLGVSVSADFGPEYVVLPKAKKIIAELSRVCADSPFVYLATDHDREGESIAWHLSEVLKLPSEKLRRITFHEITPDAIKEAIKNPRGVDEKLVAAQQARRVLDRLVGYQLSPLLWEKLGRGLSAGRVQSAALALVVERAREIKEFPQEDYWTVKAVLEKPGHPPFEAELEAWKGQKVSAERVFDLFAEPYRVRLTILRSPETAGEIESALSGGNFKVSSVERKETRRRPWPPFSTSSLQQAASTSLGFPSNKTMRVAQSLYEGVALGSKDAVGLITYMRTDSFSVAAPAAAEAADFIAKRWGPAYRPSQRPVYQTKARRAQEAHEAIRPTSVLREPEDIKQFLSPEQFKLYELIWRRFVASQMSEAVYDAMAADIACRDGVFHATGRSLRFDGFLKIYSPSEAAEEPSPENAGLPPLEEGNSLNLVRLDLRKCQTSPPPHYNEASLIRIMEKHGIGRPSTYAPTLSTLFDRRYVERSRDRKLLPTDLGILVASRLKEHFPDIVSLAYTAKIEERLDAVADGSEGWVPVVDDFYRPFSKELKEAAGTMKDERAKPTLSDEKCPLCGEPMLLRQSRFGKYLACSKFPKCRGKISLSREGTKLVAEKTGENCDLCGKPLVYRTGRRGRFIACSAYPACKNSYAIDESGNKIESSRPLPTSIKCEKCSSPMLLRTGRRGPFLACSGYPKCRNLKPVDKETEKKLRAEAEALKK